MELADKHSLHLPAALRVDNTERLIDPLRLTPDKRGWFRFQRLYDAARACVRDETDMRRIINEAAADDSAEGSRRLELQIDPTTYAPHVGGLTAALEIILDAARSASAATGVEIGIIVAASRTRHPLDARALARLAVRHAGDGPGGVIGFGLSNDERRGDTGAFAKAFEIAQAGGLVSVPHGCELLGPTHGQEVIDHLRPTRVGHGVRFVEDNELLRRVVDDGIALELCPSSNVALGVYDHASDVPLPQLYAAGAPIALGADDPLLFGDRLLSQYEQARNVHGFSDATIAELARQSISASLASPTVRAQALADIDMWLASPNEEKSRQA